MRSPGTMLTAAVQALFGRPGRVPESPPTAHPPEASERPEVSLIGRVHPESLPIDMGVCSVVGCGAPAVVVADRPNATTAAFCARCAEELHAILANGFSAGPAPG
ncbi:hypothetical protein [Candidatus Aeolococcus gillhamiae]